MWQEFCTIRGHPTPNLSLYTPSAKKKTVEHINSLDESDTRALNWDSKEISN